MKKRLLGLSLLLLLYTPLILFLSDGSGDKLLFESAQPEQIDYQSFGPYRLIIEEGAIKWRTSGWPRGKTLRVYGQNSPGGHMLDLEIAGVDMSQAQANWTPDGVELMFNTGHSIKIPKNAFISGR